MQKVRFHHGETLKSVTAKDELTRKSCEGQPGREHLHNFREDNTHNERKDNEEQDAFVTKGFEILLRHEETLTAIAVTKIKPRTPS